MSIKLFSLETSAYTRYSNSVNQVRECESEKDRVFLRFQQITEIASLGKNILFIASLISIVAFAKLAALNFVSISALKGVIVITALVNFMAHQLTKRSLDSQQRDLSAAEVKYDQAIEYANEVYKEVKCREKISKALGYGVLTSGLCVMFIGGRISSISNNLFFSSAILHLIIRKVGYQVSFLKRS